MPTARLAGLLLLALVALSCGPKGSSTPRPAGAAPGASSKATEVTIKTFLFDPKDVNVTAGSEVTWINLDDIRHTITLGQRGHPSGDLDMSLDGVGAKTTFTFTKSGTFPYHCKIHPGMDAEAVVG